MQRLLLFVNWHNCHSWKVASGIIYFRRIHAVKPWPCEQLGNPKHKINHAVIQASGLTLVWIVRTRDGNTWAYV